MPSAARATSSSPALELIRAVTASAHRTLEQRLEVAAQGAGESAYRRYVAAVLGWLEPLEPALWAGPWPEALGASGRSGKSEWVRADLSARGLSVLEIAAIPRQHTLPPLGSLAQRFGVAYVVEGAQLGGQVLLRQLGPRVAPLPTRWLEGYGREGAQKWRSFLAALASTVSETPDARLAAESARATFEWLEEWFVLRGVA